MKRIERYLIIILCLFAFVTVNAEDDLVPGNPPVEQKSTNNNLTKIMLDNKLVEGFSKDKLEYNVTVDANVNSVNITVEKEDSKSTATGDGEKKLEYGINTLKIVCTSESGEKKNYIIKVTRTDNRNDDATIKSIKVNGGNIQVDEKMLFNVETNITKLDKVEVVPTNEKAKVTIDDYTRLKPGDNNIKIEVQSEKGTKKVYTLVVNRKDDRENDNKIKSIKLNGVLLDGFSPDIDEYNFIITKDVTTIEVECELNSEKAKFDSTYKGVRRVKISKDKQDILVKAIAENETVKTYTIHVTRNKNSGALPVLKNLEIEGCTINFIPTTTTYEVVLKDGDKLGLTIETNNENDEYDVIGNENLKNGSIVQVIVKDEKSNQNIYTINVKRDTETNSIYDDTISKKVEPTGDEKSTNSSSTELIICGLGFLLELILAIALFAQAKKNKNENM